MLLFPVVGHGWKGYARNIKALRQLICKEHPDIVHAHYSTCGFLVSLALIPLCLSPSFRNGMNGGFPKTFISILGSFPTKNLRYKVIRWFIQHVWNGALTKSERTRSQLDLPLPVVPNGVNLDIFYPMETSACRQQVGFADGKKYVVWCSNPERPEKNWSLAKAAIELVQQELQEVELVPVYNKTPQEVATYMNAADCMLLTSDSEGSPNVVKEAMACNCPIVTTDVGDVTERLTGLDNCYIVKDNDLRFTDMQAVAPLVAEALKNVLTKGEKTLGYQRIQKDGLAIDAIATRIVDIYNKLLNK